MNKRKAVSNKNAKVVRKAPAPELHKRRFDQLLDDAILGVPKPKKK